MAAPLLLDMVLETATNPGTASFVLNGAVQDRRSFASAAPSGGQVFYFADDGTQAEWGVGTLTVGTPNALSRQSIAGTTQNTTQALNFTGTVRVYSWLPAAYMPRLDGNGLLEVSGLQADTLTVGKTAVVPAVSDWTTYQAVGAKDADARYVQSGGIVAATMDASGAPSFKDTQGAWHVVQPYGDYATNSALSSGLSGKLNVDGATATTSFNINHGGSDSHFNADGQFQVWRSGTLLFSVDSSGTIQANGDIHTGTGNWLYTNTINPINGSVLSITGQLNQATTPATSDRSNNVPTTYWVGQQLPMDASQRIEAFTVSNVYSSTRVNFPTGFSATPQSVVICDAETGDRVLWCKAMDWDAGGFTFMANASNTCPLLSVIAIGDR